MQNFNSLRNCNRSKSLHRHGTSNVTKENTSLSSGSGGTDACVPDGNAAEQETGKDSTYACTRLPVGRSIEPRSITGCDDLEAALVRNIAHGLDLCLDDEAKSIFHFGEENCCQVLGDFPAMCHIRFPYLPLTITFIMDEANSSAEGIVSRMTMTDGMSVLSYDFSLNALDNEMQECGECIADTCRGCAHGKENAFDDEIFSQMVRVYGSMAVCVVRDCLCESPDEASDSPQEDECCDYDDGYDGEYI